MRVIKRTIRHEASKRILARTNMESVKTICKRVLPAPLYSYGGAAVRLFRHPAWTAKLLLSAGLPSKVIHFGVAPGDDLLCTAVLRELTKRDQSDIWMMTNYPELFAGNRDVCQTIAVSPRTRAYAKLVGAEWLQLEYAAVDWQQDRSVPPKRHIIAELCFQAGVSGPINIRPYYYPSPAELEAFSWCKGMIAVQSSGLGGQFKMANKQWYPDRFQAVVGKLGDDFDFIQVGGFEDPPVQGVARNMQGRATIRETAAILANCQLFVGNVGFLMHLARAVDTRSVIIYGGREAPWQSGYSCNINIYSAEPCAPCWLWNRCEFNRICMDKITSDHVASAVTNAMDLPRAIEDDVIEIDAPATVPRDYAWYR